MNVPTIFSRLRQLPSRQKSRALDFRRLHFANWRVTTSMRSHGRHRAISLTRIRERAGTCLLILASGLTTPTAVSAVVRTRLTWVNGVGHNLEHMNLPTSVISKLFGGTKPEFCHNPTAMTTEQDYVGYLGDMAQVGSPSSTRFREEFAYSCVQLTLMCNQGPFQCPLRSRYFISHHVRFLQYRPPIFRQVVRSLDELLPKSMHLLAI